LIEFAFDTSVTNIWSMSLNTAMSMPSKLAMGVSNADQTTSNLFFSLRCFGNFLQRQIGY